MATEFKPGQHWRPRRPHWDRGWLQHQYETLGRSSGDIAREHECTDATILFWLRKFAITRRSVSETRTLKHWGAFGQDNPMHGRTGRLNPRYVDGSSPDRQRLYVQGEGRAFLRVILARDRYRCRRCGEPKTTPKSLHVHHLKPWAGNPSLRFDEANAVAICRQCHHWIHSRANVSREWLS